MGWKCRSSKCISEHGNADRSNNGSGKCGFCNRWLAFVGGSTSSSSPMGMIAPAVKLEAPGVRGFDYSEASVTLPAVVLPEVSPGVITIKGDRFSSRPPRATPVRLIQSVVNLPTLTVGGMRSSDGSALGADELPPGLTPDMLNWLKMKKPSEWAPVSSKYRDYNEYLKKAKDNYGKHKKSGLKALPGIPLFHVTTKVTFDRNIRTEGLKTRSPVWGGMAKLDASKDGYLSFSTGDKGAGTMEGGETVILRFIPPADGGFEFRCYTVGDGSPAGAERKTTSSVPVRYLEWKLLNDSDDRWAKLEPAIPVERKT